MITAASTLVDVAFEVCSAMHEAGFTIVMTGGSAATFHAPDAYQSADIDFVITLHGTAGEAVLRTLGYRLGGGQSYVHGDSPLPLDFPPGPLMVGADLITRWDTVRRDKHLLHVLSATDSCRDRLAQFLFWNDFSALEQALGIYRAQRDHVDLEIIRAWCAREHRVEKFELFASRLRGP